MFPWGENWNVEAGCMTLIDTGCRREALNGEMLNTKLNSTFYKLGSLGLISLKFIIPMQLIFNIRWWRLRLGEPARFFAGPFGQEVPHVESTVS